MEKNAIMRKYELVVIVDAKLADDTKETIRKEVADVLGKCGGKVINSQVWLEKHKLTFPIKKCNEGTYYLINFEGPSQVVGKARPLLRLNEKILRFDVIKLALKATAEAAR